MNTKLHIGNVSSETTEKDLQALFSQQGPVSEVDLVMNREEGSARGFAFVTMVTTEGAEAAIEALNGQTLGGRFITVNKARPREDRPADPNTANRSPRRSYSKLY